MKRRRIKTKSCTCSLTELSLNKVDPTKQEKKKRKTNDKRHIHVQSLGEHLLLTREQYNNKRIK